MAFASTTVGYLVPPGVNSLTQETTVGAAASPDSPGYFDPAFGGQNKAFGANSQVYRFEAGSLGQLQVQATNTQVQVAGFTPPANFVGNTIRIPSVSTVPFMVIAVSGNNMTLSRSPGATGTLLNGVLGGAQVRFGRMFASVSNATESFSGKIYVQVGTYVTSERMIATGGTSTGDILYSAPSFAGVDWESFTTTPGDGPVRGGAIIQPDVAFLPGSAFASFISILAAGLCTFNGFTFDGNNHSTALYVNFSSNTGTCVFINCVFKRWTGTVWMRGATLQSCEFDRTGESAPTTHTPGTGMFMTQCRVVNFGRAVMDSIFVRGEIINCLTGIYASAGSNQSRVANTVVHKTPPLTTLSGDNGQCFIDCIFSECDLASLTAASTSINGFATRCTNNNVGITEINNPFVDTDAWDFRPYKTEVLCRSTSVLHLAATKNIPIGPYQKGPATVTIPGV